MTRSRRFALLGLAFALLTVTACGGTTVRSGTASSVANSATAPSATNAVTDTSNAAPPDDSVVDEPAPSDTTVAPDASDAPNTTTHASGAPTAADCPDSQRGAVVYRPIQRGILCDHGAIVLEFLVTTARRVPKPGEFVVSSRNRRVRSTVGGHVSTMTNFVAFTKQSPRIAFHTVPKTLDGNWVQPLSSVGTLKMWGASSGCMRVLPDVSKKIWDFLRNGDKVRVIG